MFNATTSVFSLSDHEFKTGDKILYKSSDPALPLVNNDIYFVVRIDKDSFKLTETKFKSTESIPETITLTAGAGAGHTVGLINPPINLTRGYKSWICSV